MGKTPSKMSGEEEDYSIDAAGDAGASTTYPLEAGQIRKGGYIVVKGRPCKVVDVSTSKTGKHGHAKCHFVTIDIFTGKKLSLANLSPSWTLNPSSHLMATTCLQISSCAKLSSLISMMAKTFSSPSLKPWARL